MKFNPFSIFKGFKSPLKVDKILPLKRKRKLTWKSVGKYLLYAGVGFVVLVALMFAWFSKDLPTPGKIAKRSASQSTKIYDRTGEILLYETGEQKRTLVKSDQISDNLKKATVSVEDESFYRHMGFDPKAILRAVYEKMTFRTKRTRGASTITQQFVKNALLTSNRSLTRKIKELILSFELEIMYDKDEILTMYLNEIPYGNNTAGAEAASKMYFGITAKELTLAQAATLAAIPQAPTYYSPYGTHTDDLIGRRNYVLDRMVSTKAITTEEATVAKQEDTTTVGTVIKPRKDNILAPHFAMYVIERAANSFGEEVIQKDGLKIITTLDYEKQKLAEQAIADGQKKLSSYGASNAALASVDTKSGEILAMVGSIDYFNTEIDGNVNVADSERQPGSSFKPIAYATAFKSEEFSPATILFDLTTDFGGGYVPKNYDGGTEGPVTIRYALGSSLNIPAVKIMSLAGIDEVIRTAEDLGITTLTERERYGLSLVLGAGEVRPVEMAGAFGVFGNGGVKHDLKSILKVTDANGKVVYEYKSEDDPGREALNPEIAYEISNILSDNQARSAHMGSKSALYFSGKSIAAKTGTTTSYKDAWTIGFSRSIATAVWVGNNDSSAMKSGAAGLVIAAPIFHNYMDKVVTTDEPFERPAGIKEVTVDKMSTKLPTENSPETITDIFASWQVPKDKDDIHIKMNVCKANGLIAPNDAPGELVEERTFTNIHSERPDNSNWEGPVRAWAQSHNIFNLPPSEKCDLSNVAPTISISAPNNGATVSGQTTISANASAISGVKSVLFYVDGVQIASDAESPYTVTYNFSSISAGSHTISATVTSNANATAQASVSVNVEADTSAPTITNITASKISAISYAVAWTTNEPSTSQVVYGTTSDLTDPYTYSFNSALDSNLVTSHSVTITLTAGSTYYYRVKSKDAAGNLAISDEKSFFAVP
jgi:penicillin-binding protein 1C